MKVLFLSNEHDSRRSRSAYTHRLESLRRSLEQQGIATSFLSLREQPIRGPLLTQPMNLPFLRTKIGDYDFIHAGGNAAYTAAFLKPFTRAKIIHDVHGDSVSEAQLKRTARRDLVSAYWLAQAVIVDAIAYRFADYFLAVSTPLQDRIVGERRISAGRIGLVRNGVNLDLFEPLPPAAEGEFVVCYAGGFQHWQGIDNLIDAIELLSLENVRFKIIGFTDQYAALKSQIGQRLGPRVELLDRMTQAELVAQLASANALIIPRPSHRAVEVAFPTKFTEYLALGKPIIVCAVDETACLVRQHQCGLVSEPTPAALAETIRAAACMPRDKLQSMGWNARCLAEREFSWDEIGRGYGELLSRWSVS